MQLNQSKVPEVNDTKMRGALTAEEKTNLDAAIAADGQTLVEFLTDMRDTEREALRAKRAEIRGAPDRETRKALQAEGRKIISKKVGAQAYLKAME